MDPTGIEMGGVTPGLIAIGIGLIVTFAGYGAFRFVLALVGALFGFSLGVGIVAGLGGDGVMGAIGMMAAGLVLALLFGWLAFAFYQAAVLVGLGWLGFILGVFFVTLIGVEEPAMLWLVGALVAAALVVLGLLTSLATWLVVIVTALAGADLVVTGLMLLFDTMTVDELYAGNLDAVGWWGLAALALGIAGIVVQWRAVGGARSAAIRDQWSPSQPRSA